MYSVDEDDLILNLDTYTFTEDGRPYPNRLQTPPWLNEEQGPVRALDMTEQNYEEQDAEAAAAAASQGTPQAQASQSQDSSKEELEDNFHVDLD